MYYCCTHQMKICNMCKTIYHLDCDSLHTQSWQQVNEVILVIDKYLDQICQHISDHNMESLYPGSTSELREYISKASELSENARSTSIPLQNPACLKREAESLLQSLSKSHLHHSYMYPLPHNPQHPPKPPQSTPTPVIPQPHPTTQPPTTSTSSHLPPNPPKHH